MNASITGSKKKFAWQDIAPTNHEVARQDMAPAIKGLLCPDGAGVRGSEGS